MKALQGKFTCAILCIGSTIMERHFFSNGMGALSLVADLNSASCRYYYYPLEE
jgi:hypothetical protein